MTYATHNNRPSFPSHNRPRHDPLPPGSLTGLNLVLLIASSRAVLALHGALNLNPGDDGLHHGFLLLPLGLLHDPVNAFPLSPPGPLRRGGLHPEEGGCVSVESSPEEEGSVSVETSTEKEGFVTSTMEGGYVCVGTSHENGWCVDVETSTEEGGSVGVEICPKIEGCVSIEGCPEAEGSVGE